MWAAMNILEKVFDFLLPYIYIIYIYVYIKIMLYIYVVTSEILDNFLYCTISGITE